MSLFTGFHYLPGGEDDPFAPMGAATFLDIAPTMGMRSPERLCRPYVKGRPDAVAFAAVATTWHRQGCRVQCLNEPNLQQEGFGRRAIDYARWFGDVRAATPAPRLYWAGMSPGVPDWERWYELAEEADGVCVHAYGTFDRMRETVAALLPIGRPIWVAECNFGAGQEVARDRWADEHLRPFLDWCSTVPQVEAVTYFAYKWPTPDIPLPTPVDAKGTRIETVLRTWTPPEVPVPTLNGIDTSNNNGTVDLIKVQAAGYGFVIAKASGDEGASNVFLDPVFPDTWRQAGVLEMPRIAYTYGRPSVVSPAQSVTTLERAIQAVGGLKPGDNVALDLEDDAVPADVNLLVWTTEWLALAEQVFGAKAPLLYSGLWYMQPHGLDDPALGRYPLWYASYQATPPPPPRGFDRITIWQNSASATVPGVQGAVDTDVFFGDLAALRGLGRPASAGSSGPDSAGPDAIDDSLNGIWARLDEAEEAIRKTREKVVALKASIGRT